MLATGDTSAVIGHNIVAYHNGWTLSNLKERATPPLSVYATAPFLGLFGDQPWAARLPFAIFGFATVILLVYWLWVENVSIRFWGIMGIGILSNVSLFLYCRQCRYYSLALLLTVVSAFFYTRPKGRANILMLSLSLAALLSTHTMSFAALVAVLCADFLFWGRRSLKLSFSDWILFFVPLSIIGLIVLSIWNPFSTAVGSAFLKTDGFAKLKSFWFNWRDLNATELGVGVLIIICPFLYSQQKNPWLLRAPLALFVYVLAMTIVNPIPVTVAAEIRYLAPVIPLCIFIGALTIHTGIPENWQLACAAAFVAFGTNILSGAYLYNGFPHSDLRSTPFKFAMELLFPPSDVYTIVSGWVKQNVRAGESIWVVPENMAYPLMFHAPDPVYAWQLEYPPKGQFIGLPAVHFRGATPPDFIIAFGPVVQDVVRLTQQWKTPGMKYSFVSAIDFYWRDMFRAEICSRTFDPITNFDRNSEAVYVFKKTPIPNGAQ